MSSWRTIRAYSRRRKLRAALGLGVLALTLLVAAPSAYAATITVNTLEDELNADGDCSLREAIEAANTNAAVDACAAGDPAPAVDTITFGVTGTITLTAGKLVITEDLTIDGPGAASLTVDGNNVSGIFEVDYAQRPRVGIRDLTIANGSAVVGGGISNGGTLTVTNSVLSRNSAFEGAGIRNGSGRTVTVSNSTFSENSASRGGGIHNDGALTVSNSTFSANSASGGAGISSFPTTTTVTNSTFVRNTAEFDGGGISAQGPLTVSNSTFSGNRARDGAGILRGEPLTVTNSTFADNSATGTGGGIRAGIGALVSHSTFSGNSAVHGGGGISSFNAVTTLRNSIVANSPAGGNCVGGVVDGGGNFSWPDATCPGVNQDPLLDPAGLQDNGGPTQTIALQAGSPAIDFAIACPPPATDQRGVARPQGPACDSGAYEREATVVRVPQHFQSYDLNEPERVTESGVTLIDQFGSRTVRLEEVEWLMNPVEKRRAGMDPEPIQRPDEHLTCYGVGYLPSANRTVHVRNQFVGDSSLRIGRPLTLCAPAAKTLTGTPGDPPQGLNHFQCYDVTGEMPLFRSETLTLHDQFGTRTVRIDRARELCNPVEKRRTGRPAEPIVHPDEHLVCYRIVSHTPAFSALNVFTRDQFGLDTLRVVSPRRLCVPSEKIEGAATG